MISSVSSQGIGEKRRRMSDATETRCDAEERPFHPREFVDPILHEQSHADRLSAELENARVKLQATKRELVDREVCHTFLASSS